MSTVNESISRIRSLLLNPKTQHPTTDQLFTNLLYEFQNFINEVDSTGLPWLVNEQIINVTSGFTDYLVTNPTGKVLFVIAYPQDTAFGPVSLDFADLADVSSDFFLFSPLDWGFSPDFNEAVNFPFPFDIAFYRKDNDLYFRLPPFAYTLTSIKIVYSTGDWLQNLSTESTAVLSQYHSVPEVSTALNLLPAAQWDGDRAFNQEQRFNLKESLLDQRARYSRQFMLGRRMITADLTTTRTAFGE